MRIVGHRCCFCYRLIETVWRDGKWTCSDEEGPNCFAIWEERMIKIFDEMRTS